MNEFVVSQLRELDQEQRSFVATAYYNKLEESVAEEEKVGSKELSFFLAYQGYLNAYIRYPHSQGIRGVIRRYKRLTTFHALDVYDPLKTDFENVLKVASFFTGAQILFLCYAVISRIRRDTHYGELEHNYLLQRGDMDKEEFDKISQHYVWWAVMHGYEQKTLMQDTKLEALKRFTDAGSPNMYTYFPMSIPIFNMVKSDEYDGFPAKMMVTLIERAVNAYGSMEKIDRTVLNTAIRLGEELLFLEDEIKIVDVHVQNLRKIGYDNLKQWMSEYGNLYAGRSGRVPIKDEDVYSYSSSVFANPFKVAQYGLEGALELYEKHLYTSTDAKWENIRLKAIEDIPGKTLGCWCEDAKKCHCGILKKYVEEQMKQNK